MLFRSVLEIGKDGVVKALRANISHDILEELNRNMLMFYTGETRSADTILSEQSRGAAEEKKDVVESMHYIKELGYKILEAVERGNLSDIGHHFHAHWQHKKKISSKMSNERFDKIYDTAREHGALGGKISGAGGGGFFTFYIESGHKKFQEVMAGVGLREMRYRFDLEGSKVLADF